MAVDVGIVPSPVGGGSSETTCITSANPANENGAVDTVYIQVWSINATSGKIAAVSLSSGNDLYSTDVQNIAAFTAGALRTISGLDIDFTTGQFIGCWIAGGDIAYATPGSPSGFWYDPGGDRLDGLTHTFYWAGTADIVLRGEETIVSTTVAPTTTAPTTTAPTTLAPTTLAPTTVAPTTLPPTTIAPTTPAPSITKESRKMGWFRMR